MTIGRRGPKQNSGWSRMFTHLVLVMVISAVFSQSVQCYGADLKTPVLKTMEIDELSRGKAAWIILDARPVALWEKAHIPGAVSFSWETHTRTDERNIPYRVKEPRELAAVLGSLGIGVDTPVVVYGDADTSWGGEGWVAWVLTWLGHKGTIAILDGGIEAWKGKGLELVPGKESGTRPPTVYQFSTVSAMMVSANDLYNRGETYQLVDTRSTLEWLRSRIPGAVHIPWEKFFTARQREPLDRASLIELLRKNKIAIDKPVVYYCTGGIRSGYAWMVHELAGLPRAINYEGGTEEWNVVYP